MRLNFKEICKNCDGIIIIPGVFIIVGVFLFLISLVGCCGGMTDNSCLKNTYGVVLSILLMAELGLGIAGFIYKDEIKTVIQKVATDSMANWECDPNLENGRDCNAEAYAWDSIQVNIILI